MLFPPCLDCTCLIDGPRFEQQYMLEMVEARVNPGKTEIRYDLFSGLLDASQDELNNGAALNDEELIGKHPNVALFRIHQMRPPAILGNMFIFLLAGHEVGLFPYSGPMLVKILFHRPQRTHCVTHLACWRSTRMSKRNCINTSKTRCPI